MCRIVIGAVLLLAPTALIAQQRPVPQPFPRPAQPITQAPPPSNPPAPTQPGRAQEAPTEARLGVPIFPGAQFIASYDAGRGQRYYLFGSTAGFAELVAYYKTALKQRGEMVFEAPAIHMFDTGRFREETMAFPPSVTIKDYTFGGSAGFLNPKPGAQPARFPTIIQIVPAAEGPGVAKR